MGIIQVPKMPCIGNARGDANWILPFFDPFQTKVALLNSPTSMFLTALLLIRGFGSFDVILDLIKEIPCSIRARHHTILTSHTLL